LVWFFLFFCLVLAKYQKKIKVLDKLYYLMDMMNALKKRFCTCCIYFFSYLGHDYVITWFQIYVNCYV
jgi:hypothetical protein